MNEADNKRLWLVTANMYMDGYGSEIGLVGIFEGEDQAARAVNEAMQKGYQYVRFLDVEVNKVYGGSCGSYEDPLQCIDMYLGGFVE